MHAYGLHAGLRVYMVYNEGRLYSLLCGLYADIFDYFWKIYSIKLKVSDFYL